MNHYNLYVYDMCYIQRHFDDLYFIDTVFLWKPNHICSTAKISANPLMIQEQAVLSETVALQNLEREEKHLETLTKAPWKTWTAQWKNILKCQTIFPSRQPSELRRLLCAWIEATISIRDVEWFL